MYIAVMIFNTFTISRYKLINLLNASKKNEQIKIKNLWVCILVFHNMELLYLDMHITK